MRYVCMMLACLLMVGCQEEELVPDYGEGVGYLRLKLGKVDVELSSTTKAEAGELPEELVPETTDDFMVDVKMGNKSVEGFPKKYSDIEADGIPLNAGTYTVIAYHGENELIQTEPYFEGSASVEIFPGEEDEAKITASLANAMLEPAVSESLQKHYSDWKLTAKVGDAPLKLADNESSDGCLFAKAGQEVKAVFEGTNLVEMESTHEWTVISSAVAQTKYVIQCDPDLSAFENIKITATAKHTYDAENMLTGTDVTLSMEGNNAPLDLVDGWNIQLLYNNTAIRTYTSKPEDETLMNVADGWPYVPQGSTLAASIHLKTGEMINLTSVEIAEIPQPEFTATVSGSTSYSVYKASGADEANTKDGSSIFDIAATASIASEISSNPNYANILKVTYTTDSGQDSGELQYGTISQFNSLAWQKHALSATISFDGVEKTSVAVECDVTGLPYAPKAMVEADWEFPRWSANWKYDNGAIQLGGVAGSGECTATSTMEFYIPENIGVQLNTNVTIRALDWWVDIQNTTFTVSVNGTKIISQYSDDQDNDGAGKNYSLSGTGTFSPEACEVKLNSSYEAAGPWSKVYSLHILYN